MKCQNEPTIQELKAIRETVLHEHKKLDAIDKQIARRELDEIIKEVT